MSNPKPGETYLGDGLYIRDQGYEIILRAPRFGEDHWVSLDDRVLEAFIGFLADSRGLDITVTRKERALGETQEEKSE